MFYRALFLPILLFLAGCGPIIGASMVAGGGVKDFKVVSGELQDLTPGSRVLVIASFAKTAQAFYICRGDDAANFTTAFNNRELFQADFHLADRLAVDAEWLAQFKQKTPARIQAELVWPRRPICC